MLLTLLALLLVLLILVFDELVVGVDIVKLLELDNSDSDSDAKRIEEAKPFAFFSSIYQFHLRPIGPC